MITAIYNGKKYIWNNFITDELLKQLIQISVESLDNIPFNTVIERVRSKSVEVKTQMIENFSTIIENNSITRQDINILFKNYINNDSIAELFDGGEYLNIKSSKLDGISVSEENIIQLNAWARDTYVSYLTELIMN